MMRNLTKHGKAASSPLGQYLLGATYHSILLRLTVVLCAILVIWSGLIVTLAFYIRQQRRKHLQSLLDSHYHLYGSKLNLSSTQFKEFKRRSYYHSSKRHPSTMKALPASVRKPPTPTEKSKTTIRVNHTHAIIKAMTKPPLVFNERVSTVTARVDLPSPKTRSMINKPTATSTLSNALGNTLSRSTRVAPRANLSFDDRTDSSYWRKLARPTANGMRRCSNVNLHPSFRTPTSHRRSFLLFDSFVHNLTPHKRRFALSTEHIPRREHRTQHLPLVMITDTNASCTNIVELDTFEDKQRMCTELERRLTRQLRASCRPRHST